MLDTEKNVIDNQFLHYSVGEYLDARNKNCRTRGQKQKSLLFTFKTIGDGISQPMEIADDETSNEHDVPVKCASPHSHSMDLDGDGIMSMYAANELQKEPPNVPEDPNVSSVVEMMNEGEPSMYKMPVRFLEAGTNHVFMVKKYGKRETMDRIVNDFVRCHDLNINTLVFTNQDDGLLDIAHRPLEVYVDCDQTEMIIYFKVEETQGRTGKRATSKDQSNTVNQPQKRPRVYLTFKDQTANRDQMDIDFEENDKFSLAIERIAEVMDLDRSKSRFFDSNGMFNLSVFQWQIGLLHLNVNRYAFCLSQVSI